MYKILSVEQRNFSNEDNILDLALYHPTEDRDHILGSCRAHSSTLFLLTGQTHIPWQVLIMAITQRMATQPN